MQKTTTPARLKELVHELDPLLCNLERSARGILFLAAVNEEGLLDDGKLPPDLYADALSAAADRLDGLIQDLRTRYDAVFELMKNPAAPASAG